MKEIILKRNELKNNSVHLRSMRFEPNINDKQVDEIAKTQNRIYCKWQFYDKFIKAREVVKDENKSHIMGKEEQF